MKLKMPKALPLVLFFQAFLIATTLSVADSAIFGTPITQVNHAYSIRTNKSRQETRLKESKFPDEDPEVKLGSKEYYKGFVTRGINEESDERVTGDAILTPTFKFVGGFSILIGALFLFFMVSNGLI